MSNPAIIDRCVDGAALAPLSADQRKELALLARRAFERLYDSGTLSETTEFDSWRHHQVLMVCERNGLREARNEDFLTLQAHFLGMLGQTAMADRRRVAAQMEPRHWALAKLRHECEAASDVIDRAWDYVSSISRSRFKTAQIEELGEKQIWVLVFDLRRNAQHRRKKGMMAPGPAAVQKSLVMPASDLAASAQCGNKTDEPSLFQQRGAA
jgi:hypothetical protein